MNQDQAALYIARQLKEMINDSLSDEEISAKSGYDIDYIRKFRGDNKEHVALRKKQFLNINSWEEFCEFIGATTEDFVVAEKERDTDVYIKAKRFVEEQRLEYLDRAKHVEILKLTNRIWKGGDHSDFYDRAQRAYSQIKRDDEFNQRFQGFAMDNTVEAIREALKPLTDFFTRKFKKGFGNPGVPKFCKKRHTACDSSRGCLYRRLYLMWRAFDAQCFIGLPLEQFEPEQIIEQALSFFCESFMMVFQDLKHWEIAALNNWLMGYLNQIQSALSQPVTRDISVDRKVYYAIKVFQSRDTENLERQEGICWQQYLKIFSVNVGVDMVLPTYQVIDKVPIYNTVYDKFMTPYIDKEALDLSISMPKQTLNLVSQSVPYDNYREVNTKLDNIRVERSMNLQYSAVNIDFEMCKEREIPAYKMGMSRPVLNSRHAEIFLGVMIVPEEQETERRQNTRNTEEQKPIRAIHPRQLNSPFKAMVIYPSGKAVVATVTYTAGGRCAIVEPQGRDGAYFIIAHEDMPTDEEPIIRLDITKCQRIVHSKNNDTTIKKIIGIAV